MKILVVEDEAPIRNNLVRMLQLEDYDVVEAQNGREALTLARTHMPGLIISDVMMPELDGYGLLEQVRADPSIAWIPLILLTARTERGDLRKGMTLGADDYLTKPFTRDELLSAIAARLKRERMQTQRAEQSAFANVEPTLIADRASLSVDARAVAMAAGAEDTARLSGADPRAPLHVHGYRMLRRIGAGASAELFLAMRESDGLELVLKLLALPLGEPTESLDRFIREHELLQRISHPNVLRIHGQGVAARYAYIAMEYFPRGDIRRRMAGGLKPSQALGVLIQVARALVEIHQLGVVHRDIKPENLLLRADGSVALADFGIAKYHEAKLALTMHGEIVGSPSYLSPEQAAGRPITAGSDLYSLGVLFHEMLVGAKPYIADRIEAILALHLFAPTPCLPEPFAEYQDLLEQLMAKEASQRFANAQSLLDYIAARWPAALTLSLLGD